CAHRVDFGLEPACVNVCPEHAIISGNMNDPNSEIAQTLSEHDVKVRKEEKETKPNLFYIDAEDVSLEPCHTDRSDSYIWNSQTTGVGHFAKFAESLTEGKDLKEMAKQLDPKLFSANEFTDKETRKTSVEVLMKKSKRVFDTPDKGILWGWEVSGYVWTKAISTGSFLVALCSLFILPLNEASDILIIGVLLGLIFLTLTGALLVMDLDQPKRFFYVLLRPHWKSWLVKGGYSITFFGLFLSISGALTYMDIGLKLLLPIICITALFALVTAIYTAFLFGQAKGRDLWQSPVLLWHMLIHSIMAGAAVFSLLSFFMEFPEGFNAYVIIVLTGSILINLFLMFIEFKLLKHKPDSNKALNMIAAGRYKKTFWMGILLIGNIIPLLLILSGLSLAISTAGLMVIIGVYLTNHIWVESPQRIPLT
ncbi:MAG TPA: 4Fe-4S ferredoxin, partial [Bacteroidetes bacterium]|nr:4Fe-4S ferredoxin [Bacteroidota bacterium]